MEGGAAPDGGENAGQRLLVIDQKIAGRGAHEDFDAGGSRLKLELGEIVDIVAGGADEEGEVAMHAVGRGGDLGGERLGAGGGRFRVRHLEHGGDAPQHGRPAPGLQILLMLEPGLAEMHLAVDHAGENVQAGSVDGLPRRASADRADLGDAAVPDANIGKPLARVIDDGSAFEHEIEGLGQVRLLLRGLPRSHKCRKPW